MGCTELVWGEDHRTLVLAMISYCCELNGRNSMQPAFIILCFNKGQVPMNSIGWETLKLDRQVGWSRH